MSEQDDFEFSEFDRRLAPALRKARIPPLVPRLGPGAGREAKSNSAQARPARQRTTLRGRVVDFIWAALVAWCVYSVLHLIWFVFVQPMF